MQPNDVEEGEAAGEHGLGEEQDPDSQDAPREGSVRASPNALSRAYSSGEARGVLQGAEELRAGRLAPQPVQGLLR